MLQPSTLSNYDLPPLIINYAIHAVLICFLLRAYSEQSTRHHLKNVYACLSASMLAAAVGSGVHLFTDILKVWTVLQDLTILIIL